MESETKIEWPPQATMPEQIWLTFGDPHWWPTEEEGDIKYIRHDAEQLIELRKEALKGVCVYCGEIQQYESLEQKDSDDGRQIRIAHIRQCPQRPELKLIAYCEELQEAANAAHAWIARVSNQYMLGTDDPHEVLAQLNSVLNPKQPEKGTP